MPEYNVPLRDMRFVLNEVLDLPGHYQQLPGAEEADPELVSAILEEGARFSENVLAPLNQIGDQQGCQWRDGEVTTPEGFKDAYAQFVAGGWPSLAHDPQWGGQGLPESMAIVLNEMMGTANWAWSMYPGLCHGAMNTLAAHGTETQKETYLTRLVSGEWTGTMCLTEPHCGTDLGLLRTRAEPQGDGSYRLSGTKIFISAGEHDLAENIVHIVIARIAGAPAGTKGISLFIVPKFIPADDGSLTRNSLSCGSLEHKMGIHGNATCVMNFDNAVGYLIGPANRGLNCMFTFMNTARLDTAIQGLGHAEWGFQNSLRYAQDRLQMRSLRGARCPEQAADPIIVHPEVRKLLLTQKAFAEGGRALVYHCAMQADLVAHSEGEQKQTADDQMALLTPIAKAFLTETGFESANHGLQVFGGHGYIAEWGMEQNVRDARIAMLYEGTTQIQALDLLGRKVLGNQGRLQKRFSKQILMFCDAADDSDLRMRRFTRPLRQLCREWDSLTSQLLMKASQNRDEVGAASVDYLMYAGYLTLGWLWARMAQRAQQVLADGTSEADFYAAKLETAVFYFERILPRTRTLAVTMQSGADNLMALAPQHFRF